MMALRNPRKLTKPIKLKTCLRMIRFRIWVFKITKESIVWGQEAKLILMTEKRHKYDKIDLLAMLSEDNKIKKE